jgi:hypothetical protein
VPAHAVAIAEETRPERIVGTAARHGREHALQLGGVVLAVGIEVDGRRVALVAGDLEAGAKSGAESTAAMVGDHPGAGSAGDAGGGIRGAVIHEQQVEREAAGGGGYSREHAADGLLLVARNEDCEAARFTIRVDSRHPGIHCREEGAAAGGRGRLDPQQGGQRARQLQCRAGLATHGTR